MRVGLIGTRTYENKRKIKEMVFLLKDQIGDELVIVGSGQKLGADPFIKKYALEFNCQYVEFNPAHTVRNLYSALHDSYYGKEYNVKYFFQRNKMLAKYVDYLMVFSDVDSKDILHTIKEVKKQTKKVVIIS